MAEYIAATQRIAVRVRQPAAPPSKKKQKGNGMGRKMRQTGRTVFATVGIVGSPAARIYLPTPCSPRPPPASTHQQRPGATRVSAHASHAPSTAVPHNPVPTMRLMRLRLSVPSHSAMAPSPAMVRLELSVDLSGRIIAVPSQHTEGTSHQQTGDIQFKEEEDQHRKRLHTKMKHFTGDRACSTQYVSNEHPSIKARSSRLLFCESTREEAIMHGSLSEFEKLADLAARSPDSNYPQIDKTAQVP
ncbi:hypothetical protein B0H14DRAFT_2616905 [Mycena olivaceomarginata]|nr:hypothetical protein B0H14DRAFT_2616905 [Mycena olivaceomarginata]